MFVKIRIIGVLAVGFCGMFMFSSLAGIHPRTSVPVWCNTCRAQVMVEKGINLDLEKERLLENAFEKFNHLTGDDKIAVVDGFIGTKSEAEQFGQYVYKVWGQVGDLTVYRQEIEKDRYGIYLESRNPPESFQKQKQVDEAVRRIGQQAETLSGEEQIRYINDWLMQHVVYQKSFDKNYAYSALIEGVSACNGYARAFQAICNYVGIECESIEGRANDQAHLWNRVKLNGEWKYIDVTWNSCIGRRGWYLITKEEMDRDHTEN